MKPSETIWRLKSERLVDPYITPGDRAYVVGSQDGGFPDLGWHVPGEMGGVWMPPTKLFDGYWLRVNGQWLIGAEEFAAGRFLSRQRYAAHGNLQVTRTQFVPDGVPGVIVRYDISSSSLQTLDLRFLARSDLQLVWAQGRTASTVEPDAARYLDDLDAWYVTGARTGVGGLVGARDLTPVGHEGGFDLWGPEETKGHGISVSLDYQLEVAPHEPVAIEFVLCGGSDEQALRHVVGQLRGRQDELFESKCARYAALQAASRLEAPDASLTRAWDWLKWNNDWLVCEVPGVGRGLAAGIEDYMWWFGCDSAYSVLGCLALGQHDIAISTLDLIRERSEAVNSPSGRVLHECVTDGTVVHPGCTQETPHFTEAVWKVYRWTGDLDFLRRSYKFCRRGLLEWTIGQCCRGAELLPYGYGITETLGLDLQCLDTAVHTARALRVLGGMAEEIGDHDTSITCRELANSAETQIESTFWLEEEGLYADMLATPREMIGRLRAWIAGIEALEITHGRQAEVLSTLNELLKAAESAPDPDTRRGWSLKYWIVIAPLEAGLATRERAERVLDRVEGPEFVGPHGMYLNGVDHAHTMSINTGVLAIAELRYGRPAAALARLTVMTDTLGVHMPGAISEMLPDYGCFVQAWSAYAVAWPVVAHMFGLSPNAAARVLDVHPQFPPHWHDTRLSQVRIGDSLFDLHWDGSRMTIVCDRDGWSIRSPTVELQVETVGRITTLATPS